MVPTPAAIARISRRDKRIKSAMDGATVILRPEHQHPGGGGEIAHILAAGIARTADAAGPR